MKTWSKYIIGTLVVIGSCIGSIWLPSLLNISQDSGILLGMGLGFLISFLIPNLRKPFLETVNLEHQKLIEGKHYIGFQDTLTHPTHLPVVFGIIWLALWITISIILKLDMSQKLISIVTFTPVLVSIGFSGLAMVKRKELITGGMFGYVVKKTKWAIVLGLIVIVTGFGGSIFYILAVVFNW
ncbi:MAG: hypothetical protein H7Y59_03815 [Anaerolineales bacterium]|nr:hypothetical protein [Anaerolineales bacterium]